MFARGHDKITLSLARLPGSPATAPDAAGGRTPGPGLPRVARRRPAVGPSRTGPGLPPTAPAHQARGWAGPGSTIRPGAVPPTRGPPGRHAGPRRAAPGTSTAPAARPQP